MKSKHNKQFIFYTVVIYILLNSVSFGGCANLTPLNPQPQIPVNPPAGQVSENQEYKITYNYGDTGAVQLSANNVVLTVGQKLILEPAPGLTKNTRFTSSGEYFFGNIMQQQVDPNDSTRAVFIAIKPGKGKLQIIPNTNETQRAVDLWVTVQ